MNRPLLAAALAISASANSLHAAPNSPELVIDVSTGQVLHADEATRYWYPASTTKMMTAYVALRAVKTGAIKLDTPLIASSRAAAQKPSKLGIRPGQEITLDNALKILMVKSANDLAVVIAEGIGGSVPGFASMMNAEAARLGMRESSFTNPHGFYDPNHYTSARDLALLGRALLTEFPEYRGYWGIGAVALGNKVMKNTNGLIGRYPGAMGMKTGFVCASGFNVVAVANHGGRELLTVVLGAGSGAERTIRAAQLFDKSFSSWGGSYGSLTGLATGAGYGHAPNMRGDICAGKRMALLTEEDSGGSLAYATSAATDSSSVFAIGQPQATSNRVGAAGGGRPVLGPRAPLETIAVHLGRAPGSTEVARGPGNGAANSPRIATAFAAAPRPVATQQASNAAKTPKGLLPVRRPGAQPAVAADADNDATVQTSSAPTKLLPSAITSPAPGAIGLRRPATAEARPANLGAIERSKAAKSDVTTRPGAIAKGSSQTAKAAEPKTVKQSPSAKIENKVAKVGAQQKAAKAAAKPLTSRAPAKASAASED